MSKAKSQGLFKDSVKTAKLRTPVHMNGHQFVAAGTTYYPTGEMRAIALFPIDCDYNCVPEFAPLCLEIRSAEVSIDYGIDRDMVADVLSGWLHGMRLPMGKKLVPLVWDDWRVRMELHNMIDTDMDDVFHDWRCLRSLTRMMNDIAIERGEQAPYPKDNFLSSAKRMIGHAFVEESKNDAPYRALLLAQCYGHLLRQGYKL